MGCDIHAYIESKSKKSETWWHLAEVSLDRCYLLFGLMAKGVRRDFDEAVEIKGIPADVGGFVKDKNLLYITGEGRGGDECTLENALKWQVKMTHGEDGKAVRAEHPDWHSHSWLTTAEFEDAIEIALRLNGEKEWMPHDYMATLAAMESLESTGMETRLVFWFDN